MEPYAVVETGSKQYLVRAGDTLHVEKLDSEVGVTIDLASVLAVSDGEQIEVGAPHLDGKKVTATVVEHMRGDKVVSFKQKRRKGYRRKVGHRQELTVLRVEEVSSTNE